MVMEHFFPNLSLLSKFTLLPSLSQQLRRSVEGQIMVSLSASSPHYCPGPVWGPLPGIVSHKLLPNGSSSFWGSHSGRLFQHESLWGHSSCQKPAVAWVLWAAASSGLTCLVWVLQGCQSGYLLQCAPQWIAGGEPASPLSKRIELLSSTRAVRG